MSSRLEGMSIPYKDRPYNRLAVMAAFIRSGLGFPSLAFSYLFAILAEISLSQNMFLAVVNDYTF